MSTIAHPFLHGEFAPVHEELTATDLAVTGTLPTELTGRYLRNGPNPLGDIDEMRHHWFLGNGMVHGVRLRDGRAEWYRNRYVRTPDVTDILGGEPCPSQWPADHGAFSANTNVIAHAGRTWAIVEGGNPPVELTYDLDTVQVSSFDGTLPHAYTAHPKRDPRTGELHAIAYYWGWGERVQYLVVGTDGLVRRVVDVPVPDGPMIHDMSLTERYAVIYDLPCTFNLDAAMAGIRLPYRWNLDHAPRVGLLPRDGDGTDVIWCETDSCYVFHPMNAYDLPDGRVVLDVVRHPKMFATDMRGPNEGVPVLERWIADPATGRTDITRLDDRAVEFPRVDERLVGLPHRYGYTANIQNVFEQRGIVKYDLERGTSEVRDDGAGFGFGEPVFVPRHAGAAEDDGWVVAFRFDRAADRSDLVVLDAQDITGDPVATVHLPQRVPAGFHGNWCPDA